MNTIKLICPICNKEFHKNIYEYNRRVKNNSQTDFYCSIECSNIGSHQKQTNPEIIKICPVCNKHFVTKPGSKETTFCSRSCASKGSITDYRRNKAIESSKNNFIHNTESIQKLLKIREFWKYNRLYNFLIIVGESFEFEYILDNYIYDLVLFNRRIIIEFDGPDHKYLNEIDKNITAKKYGFDLIRIRVNSNEILDSSLLYNILNIHLIQPIIFMS